MIATHCLPNGELGVGEMSVPSVSEHNTFILPANGQVRGVCVFLHGGLGYNPEIPQPIVDSTGLFVGYGLTFAHELNDDGWHVIQPSYSEDYAPGPASVSVFNDIDNDPGHGTRYVASMMRWWEHLDAWIHRYFPNGGNRLPIFLMGFSWGGFHAFHIAKHAPAGWIKGYIARASATVLGDISSAVTTPVDFGDTDTSGADVTPDYMDTVNIPGLISWGRLDPFFTNTYLGQKAVYDSAHAAGMPVTAYDGVTSSHDFPLNEKNNAKNWVETVLDPLYPKVFEEMT